jgi:flagellar motility protein MotE (MotC chaperone)
VAAGLALSLLAGASVACVAGSEKRPAADAGKAATDGARPAEPQRPLKEAERTGSLATRYCEAVRDMAAEARLRRQSTELRTLAGQVEEALQRLETRAVEVKDWLAKRDVLASRATSHLVGIFAAMRPEAASEQLARLEAATAAAILGKLEPRAASAILNDMPPEKAAGLASILADATRAHDPAARR